MSVPKPLEKSITAKEWWLSLAGIIAVVIMGITAIVVNHLSPNMKLVIIGLTFSLVAAIVGVQWRLPGGPNQ